MKFNVLKYFSKNCRENSRFVKIVQNNGYFTWRAVYLWSYLARFFLRREIFQSKVVEKIKTHHFFVCTVHLVRFIIQTNKCTTYIYIYINNILYIVSTPTCRSQWPRGLRRGSATARLLRSWLRIPPGAWMFVCCECCVLSGRGLCDELVTRPEESYRLCCVVVCDLETSWMRSHGPRWAAAPQKKSTSTCFNASAISSGSLILIFC